ncbi:MAG: hypothetical protein K2N38_09710 [Oscillospiraceae bacterium]|nr:hypothetical protein [Oscillospiraceae bacterium]
MGKFGDRLFGMLLRVTDCAEIHHPAEPNRKPKIYIADSVSPREKAAVAGALKCFVILSEEEHRSSAVLRTINPRRVITANGGLNTEWLHEALGRLKQGGSIIAFSGSVGYGGAVLLSLLSGAEIVPLHSIRRRTLFQRHSVKVGEPIVPNGGAALSSEWVNSEVLRVNKAMSAIKEALP